MIDLGGSILTKNILKSRNLTNSKEKCIVNHLFSNEVPPREVKTTSENSILKEAWGILTLIVNPKFLRKWSSKGTNTSQIKRKEAYLS